MASHPFKVTVHPFPSPTSHSCAYERGTSSRNALVFIGGLTSGPHTSPQLNTLVQALDSSSLEYSLWEFRMRSSYTGFGYSSLANDAEDIAAIVSYLKSIGKVNIVLLGSSSGTYHISILSYTHTASNLHSNRLPSNTHLHVHTKPPPSSRLHPTSPNLRPRNSIPNYASRAPQRILISRPKSVPLPNSPKLTLRTNNNAPQP